jgi:hypothetical protein
MILIGLAAQVLANKFMPGNAGHGCQHAFVADASIPQLAANHALPFPGKRVDLCFRPHRGTGNSG